jgi:hypothetical protein
MDWIIPITDRNLQDVIYQKSLVAKGYKNFSDEEKTAWDSGLKASLNTSDINRIENNTSFLAEIFGISGLIFKTWTDIDIPLADDFQRICDNVEAIRQTVYHYDTTPVTPGLPLNYFEKINDIEQILLDAYKIFDSFDWHYAGEIFAGEIIGVLE